MPLYEYECNVCHHYWEGQLPIADRNKPVESPCPICATIDSVEKVLTGAPGIGDPIRLGLRKPSEGHRDILRAMKKKLDTPRQKTNINIL